MMPVKETLVGFYTFDYIHSQASEEEMHLRGVFVILEENVLIYSDSIRFVR